MSSQRSVPVLCAIGAAAAITAPALGVPVITNGSMNGTQAISATPASWIAAQGTPDTADAAGPFNYGVNPWVLSPDGGTFVRAGASVPGPGAGTPEAIGQTITGLDIGTSYQIDFYQSNLAFYDFTTGAISGDDGQWLFLLDGVQFAASSIMTRPVLSTDPNIWQAGSVTFTATATSADLVILASSTNGIPGGGTAAFMGIDGVRISEVPAPGALGLLACAGVVGMRRRR